MIIRNYHTAWILAALIGSSSLVLADNETNSANRNQGTASNVNNTNTAGTNASVSHRRAGTDTNASGDSNSANQAGGKTSGNRWNADQLSRNRSGSTYGTSNKYRTNEAYRGEADKTAKPFNGTDNRNPNHEPNNGAYNGSYRNSNGTYTNGSYTNNGYNAGYNNGYNNGANDANSLNNGYNRGTYYQNGAAAVSPTTPNNTTYYRSPEGTSDLLNDQEKTNGPAANSYNNNSNPRDIDYKGGKFQSNDPRYRATWTDKDGNVQSTDQAYSSDNQFGTRTDDENNAIIGNPIPDENAGSSSQGSILNLSDPSTGAGAYNNSGRANPESRASSTVYDSTGRPVNSATKSLNSMTYDSAGRPVGSSVNAPNGAVEPATHRSWVSRMFSRRNHESTTTNNGVSATATNGGVGSTTTNWSQGNTSTNWSGGNGIDRTTPNGGYGATPSAGADINRTTPSSGYGATSSNWNNSTPGSNWGAQGSTHTGFHEDGTSFSSSTSGSLKSGDNNIGGSTTNSATSNGSTNQTK